MQETHSIRQAAADAEGILDGLAALGKPVYYCEVVDAMKRTWPERWDGQLAEFMGWFHEALGLISRRSLKRNGFALSAIVVLKSTGKPGRGFAALCGTASEPLDFREQQRMVWNRYRTTRRA